MLYRHYKGGLYRVVFEGLYEPTMEEVTIYMSVETGKVWVRPTKVFHEIITLDNGKFVPRFIELGY